MAQRGNRGGGGGNQNGGGAVKLAVRVDGEADRKDCVIVSTLNFPGRPPDMELPIFLLKGEGDQLGMTLRDAANNVVKLRYTNGVATSNPLDLSDPKYGKCTHVKLVYEYNGKETEKTAALPSQADLPPGPTSAPGKSTSGPTLLEFTTTPVGNDRWMVDGGLMGPKGPIKDHEIRIVSDGIHTANTNDHGHFVTTIPVDSDNKVTVSAGGRLVIGNVNLAGPAHGTTRPIAGIHQKKRAFLKVMIVVTLLLTGWVAYDLLFSAPKVGTIANQSRQEDQMSRRQKNIERQIHGLPPLENPAQTQKTTTGTNTSQEEPGLLAAFLPEILWLVSMVTTITLFVFAYRNVVTQGATKAYHKVEWHIQGFDRESHHYSVEITEDSKVIRRKDGQQVDEAGKRVKTPDTTTTVQTTTATPGGTPQTTQTTVPVDQSTRKLFRNFIIIELLESLFPTIGKIVKAIFHLG